MIYFTGLKAQVMVACAPNDFIQLGINLLSSHNSNLLHITLVILSQATLSAPDQPGFHL